MTPFPAPMREGQKKIEEGERVRKKARPDYTDTYKILVHYLVDGQEQEKESILHKAIVDAHDSYLFNDCVLRGEESESWETWACDDLETFQAWVHWLYTAKIDDRLLSSNEAATGVVESNWLELVKLSFFARTVLDRTVFNKLADIMPEKFDAKAQEWQRRNRNDFDGLWAAYDSVFSHRSTRSKIALLLHDMLFTAISSMKPPMYAFDIDQLSKRTLWEINLRWMDGLQPFRIPESREERKAHRGRYHGNFQLE